VSDKVGSHEAAMTVTSDTNSIRIGHAEFYGFVNSCFRVACQLFQIAVVRCLWIADDWE